MVRSPPWLRILQIVFGSIAVLLSVVVLIFLVIFPAAAILTIILILSIVFLIVGIERIAIGVSSLSPTRKTRITNIVLGLVVIAFSIFLMEFPIGHFSVLDNYSCIGSVVKRYCKDYSWNFQRHLRIFQGLAYWRGSVKRDNISFNNRKPYPLWCGFVGHYASSCTSDRRGRDDSFRSKRG